MFWLSGVGSGLRRLLQFRFFLNILHRISSGSKIIVLALVRNTFATRPIVILYGKLVQGLGILRGCGWILGVSGCTELLHISIVSFSTSWRTC